MVEQNLSKIPTQGSMQSAPKAGVLVVVQGLPPLLQGYSEAELKALEQKLLRKIDVRLLPILILIYVMNYLDRNAIGAARLAGMEEDLNLKGNEFQTCVTILFVGYILVQVPSTLFLQKIGLPAIYLSTCMAIWGILCACSGAVHSYAGMVVVRFLLGFFEAAFYPGCVTTLSAWYVRKELSLRTGIFYCGSMLSGAFSGLIAAGVTKNMNGKLGLSSWRWLFILEGSITVAVAICAVFILPNFPETTKWLTEEERELAIWRLELDTAGEKNEAVSNKQPMVEEFKMLIKDPKNWILVFVVYGAASAIAINSFFPTVVKSLGKGSTETLLLTSPPYLLACIVCIAVSWHADRTNERYWHTIGPIAMALCGFIICSAAKGIGPRYFGAMIMLPGIYTGFNMSIVWTANTIYEPSSKRAAAIAFNNALATVASIYGSYLYPNNAGPRFVLAFSVNAGMAFMAIIAATVLRFVLVRENKKLDTRALEGGGFEATGQKTFRYLV